jgi:hypothetical protein
MELIGLRFQPIYTSKFTTLDEYKKAWEIAVNSLSSIAKAMRDDASLSALNPQPVKIIEDSSKLNQLAERVNKAEIKNKELEDYFSETLEKERAKKEELELRLKKIKKWAIFFSLLILLSIILWSFNSFLKWDWLLNHQKKIALYISFQLLIIFSLLRIVTKNKTIKVADVIIAIGVVVLSLI